MQTIWRKTFELLRAHPALWWPVLLADAAAFFLLLLEHWASRRILGWMVLGPPSALGGPRLPLENPPYKALYLVGGSFNIAGRYGVFLLYCIALLTIALRVAALLAGNSSSPTIFSRLRARSMSLLRFSIFGAGMAFLPAVIVFAGTTYFLGRIDRSDLAQKPWVTALVLFVYNIFAAYLLSPFALAFLQEKSLGNVGREDRSSGRKAAATFAIAAPLLFLFVSSLPLPVRTTYLGSVSQNCLLSLTGSLPYIPLFIALSLIASQFKADSQFAEPLAGDEPSLAPTATAQANGNQNLNEVTR